MNKYTTLESKTVLSTRIMEINSNLRTNPDTHKTGEFYSISAPDWAVVIPVNVRKIDGKEERFISLVRQYRHGSDTFSLEFPCGNIEAGEEPIAGAIRELREETGLAAKNLIKLGSLSPNPAIMTNRVHFFVAEGVEKVSAQELDEHEEIDVLTLSEAEALDRFLGADPEASSAIMLAGVALYLHYIKND